MQMIDGNELWRQIPPEEKLELMSRAHANGVLAASCLLVAAGTLAVGFKEPWVFWGSLLFSPLVFQFVSGKSWRSLRPRVMLEYLAARSAARRYAFTVHSQDLMLNLMFRGKMERLYDQDQILTALNASVDGNKEAAVWVALFNDSVILMSERAGGAKFEFGHVLNSSLLVSGSGDGDSDYSNDREVTLAYTEKDGIKRQVKLTSHQPAALIVFEKRIRERIRDIAAAKEEAIRLAAAIALPE